jgi:uncharacterized protein
MNDTAFTIEHLADRGRFQAVIDGSRCVADYRVADGTMFITHTEVPPRLEGRGFAGRLVQAAVAEAQARGLKVEPLCSYARAYMHRHPQLQVQGQVQR